MEERPTETLHRGEDRMEQREIWRCWPWSLERCGHWPRNAGTHQMLEQDKTRFPLEAQWSELSSPQGLIPQHWWLGFIWLVCPDCLGEIVCLLRSLRLVRTAGNEDVRCLGDHALICCILIRQEDALDLWFPLASLWCMIHCEMVCI